MAENRGFREILSDGLEALKLVWSMFDRVMIQRG
jgi:hypothetical protein